MWGHMSTQARVGRGVSTGGQFTATARNEAEGTLSVSDSQPCASCGASTKRKSGMCRNCDPRSKKNRNGGKSPVAGVAHAKRSTVIHDTDAAPLAPEEIGQCDFAFVPVYRSGTQVQGATRQCKNAVRLPATRCHQHGGATETSLGRSVAKATAEANRGECFPLAAEHWEQADERLAAAEGRLLSMLETDTSRMAQLLVNFRRQQSESGVARFSVMNQMLVISQYLDNTMGDSDDIMAVFDKAMALASEPHMTAKNWERHGRTPTGDGVVVVWWKPSSAISPDREPGESDDDYRKRLETETIHRRGSHGAVVQHPLSATEGAPYEVVESPLATERPSGYGDPEEAIGTMVGVAEDMGIKVSFVDEKPGHGYAYWRADTSEIVVWDQIADGDRRAVAHALAHELGHARLGHSTTDQNEHHTPEKEMAAESFAALACAHHGIDTSELSAHYIEDWKSAQGIYGGAGGFAPMRSAVEAFDEYVTATD